MAKPRRERIFIVPRWTGLAYATLLLMVFALGFAFISSSGLTQTLGIALVVAGLVALIQSNENLRGVTIIGCHATPVPVGETPILEITLRNASTRERIGLQVRTGIKWTRALFVRSKSTSWVPVLEGGETASTTLTLPPMRRGRHVVPELWVYSIMPVGLCFAWKSFAKSGEYFVYPRPIGVSLESVGHPGISQGINQGQEGGNEDVSGHRPYEAGDPLTRMDWRVFARTGKVVVRTLEEGSGGEVTLRWEDTRFLTDDEARLEQLSYWIAQCVREGRIFRLELGASRRELSSRNVAACYEALATFGEKP